MKKIISLFIILLSLTSINAQENKSFSKNDMPIVFIDCSYNCDFDNYKKEIPFINFARERQSSDIYILITNQNIGTGGNKYTLYFEGYNIYSDLKDTLSITSPSDATYRIESDLILSTIKKGLLPYLYKSKIAEYINYSVDLPKNDTTNDKEEINDPWNNWVFSIRASANITAESNYRRIAKWGRSGRN